MAEEPAANLCDVRDAQPLAFCRASHHGYAVDGILPATDGDPHHALALSQCDRRQRSPLPGTFQVVPNPGKRTSTHGDALRRTQPVAGETGQKAEEWEYGSAWARQQKQAAPEWLATPKRPSLPRNWRALVNKPQSDAELAAVRNSIVRGTPFGGDKWISNTAVRLSLESTTRPRGRPRLDQDS